MNRWWIYQKERFPLLAHGPLIAAFSACAVSFSSLLDHAPTPGILTYLVAFGVCLLMFLQLRIADEFKDREDDARWRPYRPVPRGLVKLSELRILFVISAVAQVGLALLLDPRLLIVLGLAWTYLALMSVEFFCREWLKARPVVYLVSHMGIMPLVDFFATSCEWMPSHGRPPAGLGWFLAASFFNGIVIELGRKLRQQIDEEEGVETYSRLWGKGLASGIWLIAMVATFGSALVAADVIGAKLWLSIGLGLTGGLAVVLARRFTIGQMSGKRLELVSALWTLMLYLLLGLLPRWIA